MSIWGCLIFISIYLIIIVGLTRMRAELGTSHSWRSCYVTPSIHDNLHIRYTPSPGGESDDAVHAELVEWSKLRIVSDAPDA